MKRNPMRERLVEIAAHLILKEGAQAISVERILDEAGVARQTLYKHFLSKGDLVLAAEQQCCGDFRAWFRKAANARARRPQDRLVAVFDILDDWFNGKAAGGAGFAQCAFVTGCVKLSDLTPLGREIVLEHKRSLFDFLLRTAKQARAQDPDRLARELMLLMEGAMAIAHGSGDRNAALRARTIAVELVDGNCPAPGAQMHFANAQSELC